MTRYKDCSRNNWELASHSETALCKAKKEYETSFKLWLIECNTNIVALFVAKIRASDKNYICRLLTNVKKWVLSRLQTIREKSARWEKHARHEKNMWDARNSREKKCVHKIMWKLTTHISRFDSRFNYFLVQLFYSLSQKKIPRSRA